MKTIAFSSQKGGSGKTTLAVHLAVSAEQDGERVVIVDTDFQKSAITWRNARESNTPKVIAAAAANLDDVLAAARHDAITMCIVDTAPHVAPDAALVVQKADLVIIPCRPTAFDIAAAGAAVDILRASGAPGVFVLSACPVRAPEIAETRGVLKAFGLPVAPVEITDRRAFARAVASGRAVTEFDSKGKAAQEIRSLWIWIKEELSHGSKTDRTRKVQRRKHVAAA
jgi:chromosome partitioning protein